MPETIVLSGEEGVLAAVPSLLGFHPTESVVLVTMAGPMHLLGPVARMDYPEAPSEMAHLAKTLLRYADEAIVVVYSDRPPLDAVFVAAVDDLIPVIRLVYAGNAPQPLNDQLVVANVAKGRGVLRSRESLRDSIEHQQGLLIHPLVPQFTSVGGRDKAIARLIENHESVGLLIEAVRSTPDSDVRLAHLCSALALVAYRHGNGALAQVALDRGMKSDPEHRLSQLVLMAVSAGMPPESMATLAKMEV